MADVDKDNHRAFNVQVPSLADWGNGYLKIKTPDPHKTYGFVGHQQSLPSICFCDGTVQSWQHKSRERYYWYLCKTLQILEAMSMPRPAPQQCHFLITLIHSGFVYLASGIGETHTVFTAGDYLANNWKRFRNWSRYTCTNAALCWILGIPDLWLLTEGQSIGMVWWASLIYR